MEPTAEPILRLSTAEDRLNHRIWKNAKGQLLLITTIDDGYLENIQKFCEQHVAECDNEINYLYHLEYHKEPGGGTEIIREEKERDFWAKWVDIVKQEKQRRSEKGDTDFRQQVAEGLKEN